jgi:UDP-N-acetyl-D-glucosamine dehydrogenase
MLSAISCTSRARIQPLSGRPLPAGNDTLYGVWDAIVDHPSNIAQALFARVHTCARTRRSTTKGFAMTLDFLIETLVKEQAEQTAPAVPAEPPWERVGARITAERAPAQTLIAVVGLGYCGLPSALALRGAGFRIIAIDSSPSRLSDIRSGRAELLEGHGDELRSHLQDADFVLTDSIEDVHEADVVLICVPTAIDRQHRPNVEPLMRACASVVQHARAGQTLVLSSTGYVGSTRELLVEPLAARGLRAGEDVFVAFSPERLDPGVPDHEQPRTPRVVGAVSETCFKHASEPLRHIAKSLHRVSSPEAAEMVKLYESTFRAVNIALAFEMADACQAHRLDPIEVTDAAATKPFGFLAHHPSAGVGGHGVGVDPHYLLHPLRERGRPAALAEEAMRTVGARPRRIALRAHELLQRSERSLRDCRVLVVGASYKPGVADCRNAPAAEIISRLLADEVHVDFHDPLVPVLRVDGEEMCGVDPDPRRDASGFGPEDYHLAILVAIHPGHDYGWLKRCPQVLDCTYRQHTGRRRFLP